MDIVEELQWRGLLSDCTDLDGLRTRLNTGSMTLYAGFDPTADSLHVGNLVPLIALSRFQKAGHSPIALAGGATGLIGDPSGRSAERQLITKELLLERIEKIKGQLARLLDFESTINPAQLLDNADWIGPITFLDFLRDVGKRFSVNSMISKESVRARMEDRDGGISFTEFSYMLLQAYDFYHLRKNQNCELQIGGSDQWGNITAGLDLCRKGLGVGVFGLTLPLITKSDGTKFGKSAGGAIWLDPAQTSPYRFYQFWMQTEDQDVIRFLKFFTFMEKEAIAELEAKTQERPEAREAQRALASEMTTLIHGAAATEDAQKASAVLFGGSLDGVTERSFEDIAGEAPTQKIEAALFEGEGVPLIELLVLAGLSGSKGQARKDIGGGGVYWNNERQMDPLHKVKRDDLLFEKKNRALIRKGKKNYVALMIES